MTKTEQLRLTTWCRHFGISRKTFYKWKRRFGAAGAAGLCDQPRTPKRSPKATKAEVVSRRSARVLTASCCNMWTLTGEQLIRLTGDPGKNQESLCRIAVP